MSDPVQPIIADISAVVGLLSPLLTPVAPEVVAGLVEGLKLLSIAEPAVYNTVAMVLQGTAPTPEQTAAKDAAIARLQNPQVYFA